MRRRLGVAIVAAALGVALLAFGALRPLPREASAARRVGAAPGAGALGVVVDSDRLDVTITTLQRSLRSRPAWRPLASLGLAFLAKGRETADPSYYSKAAEALHRSLRMHGGANFEARLGLSALAAARHDFTRALHLAREARAVNPYSPDARAVIVDTLVELGRYRSAERALQGMVDLRPDVSSYARIAYLRELRGDIAGARSAMSTALDYAGGRGTDAAWVAHQLGELLFNSGRPGAAARQYRRAAYLAPGYALAQAGLAKVAAARGDYDRAARLLRRAATRYPSLELVILLGDVYRAAGRMPLARREYALVEVIQRLYADNGFDLDSDVALFYADHGRNVADAVRRARRVYKTRRSTHVADALAWALYADGRYGRAWSVSRHALRLGTRNALFEYHAGMIARRLGRRGDARDHLRRAVAINPNFSVLHADRARRVLARLEAGS